MARSISMAPDAPVYRAVTTVPGWRGEGTVTKYEGPYDSPGAAKARVTFWSNRYRREDGTTPVTGRVEHGVVAWGLLS